jgi:hypothetical protein
MTALWHADESLLGRYVRGEAGPLDGASLEQHLIHCVECRDRIAGVVEVPPLEMIWARIRDQAQSPAPGFVERMLRRFGLSATDSLLVSVAPSLRTSWLLSLAVTLGFVGLSAKYGGSPGLIFFVLLTPLIPVAGVAFAYGPDVDPAFEVGLATPYSAARLLLLRTVAVLMTSLPVVLVAALLAPAWFSISAWCLVPALSFTAITLAGCTWARPAVTGVGLGIAWFSTVGAAVLHHALAVVVSPALLLVYAVIGLLAVIVLRLRIPRLTTVGSPL